MRDFIYRVINLITAAHTYILSLNDKNELFLDDKQLHFLIIGIFGFAMLLVIQPVFKWLIFAFLILANGAVPI